MNKQRGFLDLGLTLIVGTILLGTFVGGIYAYKKIKNDDSEIKVQLMKEYNLSGVELTSEEVALLQNKNLGASFRPSGYSGKLMTRLTEGGSETTFNTTPATTPDSQPLVSSQMGDFIVITINPGASNQEKISATSVSVSGTTATWTIANRGLSFASATTTVTANKKQHSIGETVIISNDDQFLATQYLDIDSAQTIYSIKTFSSTSTPKYNQNPVWADQASTTLASKGYADDMANAGASDSDTKTKGLVETATKAECAAGTTTGDTTAPLVCPNSAFSAAFAATTTVPVTGTDGLIAREFINATSSYGWAGNNTHSGTEAFSGTTTLSGVVSNSATTSISGSTYFSNQLPQVYANATSSQQVTNKAYVDSKDEWIKLETLTWNASTADQTFTTFAAADIFKLEIHGTSTNRVLMRLNGISATNYQFNVLTNATVTSVAAATSTQLLMHATNTPITAVLYINGRVGGTTTVKTITGTVSGRQSYAKFINSGELTSDNAELTSITILVEGTTNSMEATLYYKNY